MSHPNLTPYELTAQDLERFHKSYHKSVIDDCWYWKGTRNANGYGRFSMQRPYRRIMRAPRVAYFVFKGIQPLDKLVCHSCDHPPCVNPDHLFLGDHRANVNDAKNKGRHTHGARQGLAKLTNKKVREIRRLRAEEEISYRRLAQMFGVSFAGIRDITHGITWKHLL